MKNKLGSLLKVYFRTSFGFNKAKFTHEKKAKSSGMTVLLVFCYAMMAIAIFAMSMGMMSSLEPLGLSSIVLNIMMMAASLATLFTTIYKVNGTLFGFQDYDLQMSLPVNTRTLITSRILILYGLNALFVLIVMIPPMIGYAILAQPPFAFYLIYIILMLATPLLPIVIATVIGTLISMAASRFKRKNGLNVIFTVAFFMVFMVVWMGFWVNSGDVISDFSAIGTGLNDILVKIYPMTALFSDAIASISIQAFLLFLAISIGGFAVFVVIISKHFGKLNTAMTTNRAASNYKMTELRSSAPKKALNRREMKRYLSSSQYVLNTAVGPLLLVVVSIILLVSGSKGFGVYSDIPEFETLLKVAAPMGITFFIAMACTTSSSISLEGKALWIARSLPVDTRLILKSKIHVAMTLFYPTVIICGTLFNIALKPDPLYIVLMYAIPLAYSYFIAFFGLKCNLNNANFDWTNEVTVIKQSKPTLLTMLVGMALTIIPALLSLIAGVTVLLGALALVAILDIILYRNLMTKGVAQFESF
ncbi:MAG: hypothetical protein VB082_02735 [Christensenella sp.]|nr:hypothetical protein [Christensenella sp.]